MRIVIQTSKHVPSNFQKCHVLCDLALNILECNDYRYGVIFIPIDLKESP